MKIPNKLKVGGHTYDVKITDYDDEEKGKYNWGRTDLAKKKICIDKTIARSAQEETFFHEMLHCITHDTKINYNIEEDKEEDFVRRMASSLYQVLKDNKIIK